MVSEKKKGIGDYITSGIDVVSKNVGKFAKTKFEVLDDRFTRKTNYTFLLWTAIIFISLSAFHFLKDFFFISNTLSYFIIGLLLLVIAFFIRSNEYRKY